MVEPPEEPRVTIGEADVGAVLHLRGLNVVDVVRAEVRKASLTVAGGRIVGVDQPAPEAAAVVDLDGCWAAPSLVDMHAHVTFEAHAHNGLFSFSFDDPAQLAALRGVQNLSEALRNGI